MLDQKSLSRTVCSAVNEAVIRFDQDFLQIMKSK